MNRWLLKVTLILVSVLCTLLASEVLLQLASRVSPSLDYVLSREQRRDMPDARLGHRPQPLYKEHDSRGWRNETALDTACVVAMGDSQTYGHKVRRHEAWPQVLMRLSGVSVYNLAFGGFGPAHHELLLDEALALRPRLVIEGFYFGNDFWDAYHVVYDLGQLPEHRSKDAALLERLASTAYAVDFGRTQFLPPSTERHAPWRALLAERSRIYGLLRAAKRRWRIRRQLDMDPLFLEDWELALELTSGDDAYQVYDGEDLRTIFTPAQRASALDRQNPRILEGYRIALASLVTMRDRVERSGAHYLVVFIPTKELVFEPELRRAGAPRQRAYVQLIEDESSLRAALAADLDWAGVDVLDGLPALRRVILERRNPYPESANSHKNVAGHEALARRIDSRFRARMEEVLAGCPDRDESARPAEVAGGR